MNAFMFKLDTVLATSWHLQSASYMNPHLLCEIINFWSGTVPKCPFILLKLIIFNFCRFLESSWETKASKSFVWNMKSYTEL